MTASRASRCTAADPRTALLSIEGRRLRYAFQYDPLLAMSASRMDPLPHQIEAVYGNLLKMPRIRFLLAHDPGAGKTIMAGLLIKELRMRGAVRRVLVVVPGPLREQWRWEMRDKFDERFEIVGREQFRRGGGRVWGGDLTITSMDFAKKADVLDSLRGAGFDLVVVDEAHKMSAYRSGGSTSKTRRYRLGETLSSASRHLLFLTATPHKGDPANFRLLLDLLEPGYFAAEAMMGESVRDRNNPLFLRRAKEDMVDFDGRPLFVPRRVETPDVRLSAPERALYAELSRYIKRQNELALVSSRGSNVAFALVLLQRRFASSTFALRESLMRRRGRLAELASGSPPPRAAPAGPLPGAGSIDEASEAERWRAEGQWELLSAARSREDLEAEIDSVDSLIARASRIIQGGAETKFRQLRDTLEALDRSEPDEKVLVFTESRDTMDHLAGKIAGLGYPVNVIHGAMSPADRKDAERVFRDHTRIMVATEAAGEGINLQFCHIMVNYDLPWNPNRLEQRMGRIHRYGQKRPVLIFNMIYADTREGQIMQTLFDKIQEIKAAMGSDKVFDVISDIVPGKTLSQMMLDATVRARSQRVILREMREALQQDNRHILEYLEDGLASKYIDHTPLRGKVDSSRERQLVPEYAGEFFRSVLAASGGRVEFRGSGLAYVSMPAWPGLPEAYHAATFDKRVRMEQPGADLITFGHPAFDEALERAAGAWRESALGGAAFTDPSCAMDGHVVFCECRVVDGSGMTAAAKLVAVYVDGRSGAAERVPPSVLLDLEPGGGAPPGDQGPARSAAVREAAAAMDGYAGEVLGDRRRHNEASQKYGVRSMDDILARIGDDITDLLEKKADGERVDLAILNKRRERRRYRQARLDLRMRMSRDVRMSPEPPRVVGVVRVAPGDPGAAGRREAAVGAAIREELLAGRDARDARSEGHGFDVKSVGGDSVRFILAADARDGAVRLTTNQWLRARTLGGDCYLYAAGGGGIVQVRDPAGSLRAEKTPSGYTVRLGSQPP